ncbi:MAG TPA: LysM peptidoglycan-binding domain-containing protein, partial [Dehalococcoidia bacterium]
MTEDAGHEDRCSFCEAAATSRCRRCGKLYCDAHGDTFCDACLDPASAIPSPVVFRGSLLALVVASLVAIWLLVSPPEIEGRNDRQAEPAPTETPAETPTPAGTPTPSPTPAPPTPTPTPEPQVYIVQPGDTLSGIAQRFGVTVEQLRA